MTVPQPFAPRPTQRAATLLPPEAAHLLRLAAKTPITRADPLARVKAIEKAIERVRRCNPELFR